MEDDESLRCWICRRMPEEVTEGLEYELALTGNIEEDEAVFVPDGVMVDNRIEVHKYPVHYSSYDDVLERDKKRETTFIPVCMVCDALLTFAAGSWHKAPMIMKMRFVEHTPD